MDQDEEVKQLTQLRDSLRLLLQVEGKEVCLFIMSLCFYTLYIKSRKCADLISSVLNVGSEMSGSRRL